MSRPVESEEPMTSRQTTTLPQHWEVHWTDQTRGAFVELYADHTQAETYRQQLVTQGHPEARLVTVTDHRSVTQVTPTGGPTGGPTVAPVPPPVSPTVAPTVAPPVTPVSPLPPSVAPGPGPHVPIPVPEVESPADQGDPEKP